MDKPTVAELRALREKAANDIPDDREISERQLLNALPGLLDEVEQLRRVVEAGSMRAVINALLDKIENLRAENRALLEVAEAGWVLIANANGGDWTKATPEWLGAAERWRDRYHDRLSATKEEMK